MMVIILVIFNRDAEGLKEVLSYRNFRVTKFQACVQLTVSRQQIDTWC